MSAKLRITAWITLMMLLLAALTLVFVLVVNHNAITDDPAGRLVKVVQKNVDDVEFDRGKFEWDDLSMYSRGVYCMFYDTDGEFIRGAKPDSFDENTPLDPNVINTADIDGETYYIYDSYVDMDVTGLWVRGLISAEDRSGLMHTIIILTATLLPILLVVTIGGGWLIAWSAFRPMEKILAAADSISAGEDLSARLNITRGPSEMRRLGAAFDRMFGRLEASFDAERQFTSDASHELRTPITVILAECDRARRKAETKEDFLASINVIEQQGNKMNTLIEQLLSLTRIQQGTEKYPLRVCDLSGFVDACCDEFVPADERGMTLETDIEPGVAAAYNPSLLSRAMFNLMQNAYKYGREGGNIRVSLCRENGCAVISVKDDGPGIPKAEQEKIWQRFYRCDTSRADGGTGLGLSLVREIALVHHARAEVVSEPGKGCDFRIVLPPVKN